jgi:two-component system osmolarity sensor histidine kinase EnvZ
MSRPRLRHRLLLLVAAIVASVLLIAAVVMAQQTLGEGATRLARMVGAAVAALDRALPQNLGAAERASLARLGVELSSTPPAHQPPSAALARELLARLDGRHPVPADLRFSPGPPIRLWFRSRTVPSLWIGLPLEHLREPVARASIWILVLASLVVWTAAGVIARQLARPLERVAAVADDLLAGAAPPDLLEGATRETEQLVAALAAAARAQREQNAARERLLIGLSHDLRTPLARLRFAIELGDAADAGARAGMVADIDEMDALIGEALALARGAGDEALQSLDLVALLVELAQRASMQGEVRCAALPSSLPWRVQPLALRRALGNLIQNALRHGAPPVLLALEATTDAVCIEVRDHGRGPAAAGSGTRGFGIGLSVVRAVASAHRGDLELCTLADGFAARLRLPRLTDPAAASAGR